jgi:hypothetical protein
MKMLTFTLAECGEIFLHCLYGQEVTLISDEFSTSLFHSKWILTNMKTQKSVKFLMENFKKELKISSFGIYTLNLSSFMTILNSAYSYLMLLRQLKSKN